MNIPPQLGGAERGYGRDLPHQGDTTALDLQDTVYLLPLFLDQSDLKSDLGDIPAVLLEHPD